MESYEKKSMRRTRRNSVLQDLLYKGVHLGGRDTPIPAQSGRDAKMIHSIASLIRGKSKLLLLESPDTVEVFKLDKPTGAGANQVYLPAITSKASNLTSMRGALSQSCPYLYDKRRGSFSSVGSCRTGNQPKKQSNLRALLEAKKSNVTVTMTYLGHGPSGSRLRSDQDEVKVLQQINGGENICVFKGFVTPGEQFGFVSQRHRGYPFSGTIYVNGMMAARISSCCEYRYAPGFQQGKKSCFRLTWLAGGMPCYRCTSLRNKYNSCQQLNNGTKENLILPLDQRPGNDPVESRLSSPLFVPAKPEKKPLRKTRRALRDASGHSTESEDPAVVGVKDTSKPKRRKGQSNQKEGKGDTTGTKKAGGEQGSSELSQGSTARVGKESRTMSVNHDQMKSPRKVKSPPGDHLEVKRTAKSPDSLQDEEALTKQKGGGGKRAVGSNGKSRDAEGLKDFYEECVASSPNKHNWFKSNILERCRLQKRLSSRTTATGSEVELSEESDALLPDEAPGDREDEPGEDEAGEDEAGEEQDLQAQLVALMAVLSASDEVDQLVLRNTDLTDDLLYSLAGALRSSPSEVTELNLNLNCIGPYGAVILLDLFRATPHVKGLHLFGNRLRDHGVQTLLSGLAELQEQTAMAAFLQQTTAYPPETLAALANQPPVRSALRVFTLSELDIGGNGLSSDGLKLLASYMRHHSYLQYLGLARTSGADLAAWKELFDSLEGNSWLSHIILDESNLGDPGVRMLAGVLRVNASLRRVDLDRNGISDVGGNDVIGALLCRTQVPLRHLSLEENHISEGLMNRIQEEVKRN